MDRLANLRGGGVPPHVVQDVLDPETRRDVLTQLATLEPRPLDVPGAPLHGIAQWGCMSGPSPRHPRGPEPEPYRLHGHALWSRLGALGDRVEQSIVAALSSITHMPVVRAPNRPLGSIRRMAAGFGAPLHLDRYPSSSVTDEIRADVDQERQLVWYVMLAKSPAGGHLRFYPERGLPDQPPAPGAPHLDLDVPDGALLIHAGSQHWHGVTPPEGGDRITLGGLCLFHQSGDQYWLCA